MSVVLWPRQEVLQLVIPQLGTVGRKLNANTALNLIKRLAKFQNSDGKISFDRWLVVAKDILRWNDNCIHLFWDMLSLGTYYLSRESALQCAREEVSMDIEYIAIFLILHISEAPAVPGKIASPSMQYDSMWPSFPAGVDPVEEEILSSAGAPPSSPKPVSPVASPKKDSSGAPRKKPFGSPLSPRSGQSSPTAASGSAAAALASGNSPQSSPKKSHATSTPNTAPISSPQYLLSVRQKIPTILKALCGDGELIASNVDLSVDDLSSSSYDSATGAVLTNSTEFAVGKRILDALSLIICGGYSRDQSVPFLSSLHPLWSSDNDSSMRSSRDGLDGDDQQQVAFSELLEWLNMHLAMNDVLYPPITTATGATVVSASDSTSTGNSATSPSSSSTVSGASGSSSNPNSPGSGTHGHGFESAADKSHQQQQQPSRSFTTITSLTRSVPLVVTGCSSTYMHIVTSSSSRSSSFRKSSRNILAGSMSMSSQSFDVAELIRVSAQANSVAAVKAAEAHSMLLSTDSNDADAIDSNDLTVLASNVSPTSSFNLHHQAILNNSSSSNKSSPKGSSGPESPTQEAVGGVGSFPRGRNASQDSSGTNSLENSPRQQFGHQHNSTNSSHVPLSEHDKSDLSNDARFRDMTEFGTLANNANHPSSLSRPDQILPQAFINFCAKARMYLISPFYSAAVTGCVDSDILIGAVFGAVIVSNCQRVSITTTCRKLIVLNCVDCAFNIATLTTTIISGDCKGLVVGPYNASYRNLKNHIKLAALHPLLSTEEPSANFTPAEQNVQKAVSSTTSTSSTASISNNPNCWASLCDVVACLEAPPAQSSPQGYAVDATDADAPLLPPLPSTARLLNYEDFKPITIPFKPEAMLFENCPIRTPAEYVDSLQMQLDTITTVKAQISSMLNSFVDKRHSGSHNYEHLSDEEKKKKQGHLSSRASNVLSKKFMEWLITSGNAKQILDLIRIDADKFGAGGHHYQSHTHSTTTHTPGAPPTNTPPQSLHKQQSQS